MNKPVGGRGQKAPKPTMMRRIPEGVREAVDRLADLYREDEWDGSIEGLNLISGNDAISDEKPDIEKELAQLRKCKEERDHLDAENLKLHEQTADLNLRIQNLEEQLAQAQNLERDMNQAIADLRTEIWLAKQGERIAREKAAMAVEKGVDLAGLRDRYLLTLKPADRKKTGQLLNKFLKFSQDTPPNAGI